MIVQKSPSTLTKVRNWYARHETPISTLSLVGGFVFDAVTLTRVDKFWENFWIGAHILVVAACIVLINMQETGEGEELQKARNPEKLHFWLVNVMQFFFGGLFSAFIVFYFRSAVLAVAWPFFLLLAAAFFANQWFKRHYAQIGFQISFLFLSIYLFAIFLMPVLMHDIGAHVFVAAGGVSVIFLIVFLGILRLFTHEGFKKGWGVLVSSVVVIYLLVNGLYFLDLIPPLPLSLQDAGIYHSVTHMSDGNYSVAEEHTTFLERAREFVNIYPRYHFEPGQPAYAYSAVFSPIAFRTTITHEWQRYDTATKNWQTVAQIPLDVLGGRENGYRTYSAYYKLTPGKWRVNVLTETGQTIGRLTFEAAEGQTAALETATKY